MNHAMLSVDHYKTYLPNKWEDYLRLPEVKNASIPEIELLVSLTELRYHIGSWVSLIMPVGNIEDLKISQSVLVDVIACLKICKTHSKYDHLTKQYNIVLAELRQYNKEIINHLRKELTQNMSNVTLKARSAFLDKVFHEELLKDKCYSSLN